MEVKPDPDNIQDIPTEKLLLDWNNPRLAWRVKGNNTDQNTLLGVMWEEMAIDDLILSIAENGFFRSEPVFVIPRYEDDQYVVVEGNRRLSAVKVLTDEDVREELEISKERLPPMKGSSPDELAKLPAIVYSDREEVWEAVGFRHINGIQQWDSFSKAEYIADVHENYDVSLVEIADKVGDTHSTVQRLYSGYNLIRQAESEGIFDTEDTYKGSLHFSHLYTAADQNGFQQFLNVDTEDLQEPTPVEEEDLERLEELLLWLYGSRQDQVQPVVKTQNPDLRRLRQVVMDDEALMTLRQTGSLDEAHETALGEDKLFRDNMFEAKRALKAAMSNVSNGYDGGEKMFETAQEIAEVTNRLYSNIKQKREEKMGMGGDAPVDL
jgi:hypothetical protein